MNHNISPLFLVPYSMSYSSSFLEQLRQRLPISSVIQKHVRLMRKGKMLMGLCPFHGEKTPSFTVNDARRTYHCFGCGAHGDIIDFVRTQSHVSFVEAVRTLAGMAGLELPPDASLSDNSARQAATLFRAMDAACQWYQEHLQRYEPALQYLLKRGLTPEEIRHYRLGWAPAHGWVAHGEHMGFSVECLLQAGLVIQRSDSTLLDRFRQRIMFPIMNHQGRILAFGGRSLGQDQPKYMNSPETPVFVKSNTLFQSMVFPPQRPLMVVEGYMDVIACARYGGALAPLGTAISAQQLEMIWKKNQEPVVCFDGDRAGQQASLKMAVMALPMLKPGYSLRFVTLPADEDPHAWLTKHGAAGYEHMITQSIPLSDFLWQSLWATATTPEAKAAATEQWTSWVDSIAHLGIRRWYKDFGFAQRAQRRGFGSTVRVPTLLSGDVLTQKILVGLLIMHPDLIPCVTEDLCRIPMEPETPWLHVVQYLLLWKGEPMDQALSHILGDDWKQSIASVAQHIPSVSQDLEAYWRDIFTAYVMQVNQRLEVEQLQKTVLHRPESWDRLRAMTLWEDSQ